jgi:hypothetical protein
VDYTRAADEQSVALAVDDHLRSHALQRQSLLYQRRDLGSGGLYKLDGDERRLVAGPGWRSHQETQKAEGRAKALRYRPFLPARKG